MGDQACELEHRPNSSATILTISPILQPRELCCPHYLTDPPPLLPKHFLRMRRADDNVGDGGGDADFDARVAFLGQLALKKLVELGVEDAVGDKFAAFGDVGAAGGLGGGCGLHFWRSCGLESMGEVCISTMGVFVAGVVRCSCCCACDMVCPVASRASLPRCPSPSDRPPSWTSIYTLSEAIPRTCQDYPPATAGAAEGPPCSKSMGLSLTSWSLMLEVEVYSQRECFELDSAHSCGGLNFGNAKTYTSAG